MECSIENLKNKQSDLLLCLEENLKSEDNLQRVDTIEQVRDILDILLKKVIQALDDKDELVQVSSLEVIDDIIVMHVTLSSYLKTMLSSKSWLVRSYSIEALGDLSDISSKSLLENMLIIAHEEELPRLYYALIKMRDRQYLNKLYDLLHHDYYRIRIVTATLLEKLADKENKQIIIKKINNQLKREKEKSVINRLESILTDIRVKGVKGYGDNDNPHSSKPKS